jgi:hypothetical protein
VSDANHADHADGAGCRQAPVEVTSSDVGELRAALMRESVERRRAECRADMQTEIAKLAHDLLVREPDIDGFFGALTKEMVEESESHTCGVWLIDESGTRCDLWMVYVKDRLFTPMKDGWEPHETENPGKRPACETLAGHLFAYRRGWTETVEYLSDDPRLPEALHHRNYV